MDPTPGAQIAPLGEHDPAFRDPALQALAGTLGYHPNALLTMARRPGLLPAILALVRLTIWSEGGVAVPLRLLLACEASRGAGCAYTAAHVVHAAHHEGIAWEKLAALPGYRQSPLFSDGERRALAIATAGSTLPVANAQAAFAAARQVYSEDQMLEIVAAVAAFGWFNRWNSLMWTELETVPAEALHHVPWLAALQGTRDV